MRTVLYARKSTEQIDRQVQSLEDQTKELKALARREGFRIDEVFIESRSAKTPGTRPEFERMFGRIEEGTVDTILTWSMDRLARNPIDSGRIAYALQTGKLSQIRTFEKTYYPEDNALLMAIEGGMATSYIQNLSRNVKRGMKGKFERGQHVGKAPLGYLNDAETKTVKPDPARFDAVRAAWDIVLNGDSVNVAHRFLLSKGMTVPTRRGIPQPVSRVCLHQMLRNPFYYGFIRLNGEVLKGSHPPMVSEEEFQRARELISRPTRVLKPVAKREPFVGFIFCARCGCLVVSEIKRKTYRSTNRTATYRYYHCSGAKGCSKQALRHEEVEEALRGAVESIAIPPEIATWMIRSLNDRLEALPKTDLANDSAERKRLESRLKAFALMRADGEIGKEEYEELRSGVQVELRSIDAQGELSDSRVARIKRRANELLQAGIDAGDLRGGVADPYALAQIAQRAGSYSLNLKQTVFQPDPVLTKIASFEPAEIGSSRDEQGDFLSSNIIWLQLVDEVLNLLIDADTHGSSSSTQSLHRPPLN